MDLIKSMSTNSTNFEENTKLLFYENYKYEKTQFNVEEIFFGKAILLQQIRILRADSNPHPKIKSVQSITQTAPIHNFEIFCRNLKKYSDKFECILENSTINESSGSNDCIFPFLSEFVTNHIIIRGMYEKITICIYGVPYIGTEGHLLLETAKNDVPLEKLQYTLNDLYEDGPLEKINLTNDDIELLNTCTLDSLISPYIKCEVLGAIKRAYYINPPDVNMVEKTKTGYIYYENDLNYYSQCLYNFYLTLSLNENKTNKLTTKGNSIKDESKYFHTLSLNNEAISDEITLQSYFKKISDILKILIAKNYAFLEQDCIFRKDNEEIFNKIPESLIEIIIFALNGNEYGFSEIKSGLKLLKILTNSSRLIGIFIDKGGMELLYNLILRERRDGEYERDSSNVNYSSYASTFTDSNSLVINILALDIIYKMITHLKAFNKLMENTEKSKSPHRYFMIRENTKEEFTESSVSATIKGASEKDLTVSNFSGSSKKKEKAAEREKEKERNKKKSKREKKSKRDKKISRSSSRSKSQERNRSYSRASGASEYSSKYRVNKKKMQAKNILLRNGYQIILTLLVGKKNNIIVNMVKKIVNKITLILHLKEFKNFADMITKADDETPIQNLRLYFDKLPKMIEKIFDHFSKLEIPYKISSPIDNTGLFSDYPYKNFWIDYLKIGRKFFKKSDLFNLKSTIESLSNSSNSITEFKVITNEEAIILEEYQFVESLLNTLIFQKFQETKYYTDFSLLSKNFITYILLAKGGINFFSKNFELTMILRNFLNKITEDLINDKNLLNLTNEENFFSANVRRETRLLSHKSLSEHPMYSNINHILMKTSSNIEMSDDFIIKINFLQLRYLLEISFVFLSKFDDFIMFKLEESKLEDFIDKSLDIFLLFSQNINRSNLSKQAFIALFNNEYFIEEIISLLNNYLESEPQEFEAHITLIFEILMCVFSDINKNTDIILIEYGKSLYDILNRLKLKMQNVYDNTDNDPVNKDFFMKFETLINFLEPTKIFSDNKEIKSLMQYVNDCLFNNVQKYNLNEKPINEDNLKEENIREYVKGLKLNILNYHNSDVDYLDTLKKKNSLINELFVAVKLINLSIRINPLLLIDCVSEHIHLALRYLIVNTVHSLKSLLLTETVEYQENVKSDLELEKFTRIKEYSVLLTHLYDILSILLEHLLSSHVDNYRDNMVIDNTVNLLIILINYLFNSYSHDEANQNNFNHPYYSDINLSVVEDLQKLFASVLNAFKEICKFNTTIKLNFEKIMEKISERPSNKGPMIYIFNFMFSIINNEYTIETFVEHFMKIHKPAAIDIFTELESNTKHHAIKLGHLNEDKNFIQYVIEIGINTNNDWIMNNCANLLISIQRAYKDKSKINLYEQISDQILSVINNAFNKINKVDLSIIEEKEIPNFLHSIDFINRVIKFILIFLKSEFKFLYIFHEISNVYLKITTYFKEYLGKTFFKPNYYKSNLEAGGNIIKLANKVFDIINILFDSFVVLCDHRIGFDSIINEEINKDMHYDIVEELPNKNEIVSILKETKTFLTIDFLLELENNSDIIIVNKFLNLTLKSVNIYENLSQNFYGQIIILYSDYPSNIFNKTRSAKPIFVFNDLIRGITCRLTKDNKSCLSQDILMEILDSLVNFFIMLSYDLNYFELNEQNSISRFEMIRLNRIYLPAEEKNYLNLLITQSRLSSLINLIIGEENLSKEESVRNISGLFSQIYEAIALRNSFTHENQEMKSNFNEKIREKIYNNLLHNVTILANLFSDYSFFRFIDNESSLNSESIQLIKLPNARKIYEKLEIIYKFYEFTNTQNYCYDLPFSISNMSILNPQIQMTNTAIAIKQNINDFEKLLNWKKYRIYLSKLDNLITRTNLFELDQYLRLTPEEYLSNSNLDLCLLTESFAYKKKFTHLNPDSFQQFYNQMLNESLLLQKFANISYSITSTVIHKFSIYSSFNHYNSQMIHLSYRNNINFKIEVDFLKAKTGIREIHTGLSKIKSAGLIAPLLRTKKKINSKFNTFIYKPKFDKMPKPIISTSAATSSSISIRDTNRYASVVSGRTLSVHMDKFNPTQTVVNPTYASSEEAPKEIQQQTEQVDKEISVEDNKSEASKKEEVEKIVLESKSATIITTQQVLNEPKSSPISNPQLSFDNRVVQNQLQINPMTTAVQNKIEATKIQNMSANVINPQLNLRMVSQMSNYGQGYANMMNPSLNINMQSGMSMPNQMQTNPSPNQLNQFNPFQMNQQGMNPNLMMGQPNQMPFNYPNIRQPVNPMNMNPQMNQMYNQNIAMMNKNIMNYNQMTGQSHFNYNQMNQFQNQQQQQQTNQMMQMNSYGQNVQNVNPSLNMELNRMNQQQTMTSMQIMQLEERKNVITPSTQNNSNTGATSGNTNILSNILQVLQNPDLKQMLGKFNQPQSQGSMDDKSKDPRIRKKK